jgi:hypothetical protein
VTLITFASIKGSPGVTTLACLVGASWPVGRRAVVAECDPSSGDLAARFSLSTKTGWSSLAASARRGDAEASIESHLQKLPGGLEVLVGPHGGDVAGAGRVAGQEAGRALREFAKGAETDVIVDVGRLQLDSTDAQEWLAHSSTVCIVLRSDAASILHVQGRSNALREATGDAASLVVVGGGPYSTSEIERFTGMPVMIDIPEDSAAAAVLTAGHGSERRLARSVLVKSARRLALTLAELGPGRPSPEVTDSSVSTGEGSPCRSARDGARVEPAIPDAAAPSTNGRLTLQDQP